MATTNTDKGWLWYVRKLGKNYVLGIVDDTGTAPTSALDIEYWFDELPDEITSDNDELPIPLEFEHGFSMGCVYEILRMMGKENRSYRQDFENTIYDAIHMQISETQQPLTISPLDLRMDDDTFTTRSPSL